MTALDQSQILTPLPAPPLQQALMITAATPFSTVHGRIARPSIAMGASMSCSMSERPCLRLTYHTTQRVLR